MECEKQQEKQAEVEVEVEGRQVEEVKQQQKLQQNSVPPRNHELSLILSIMLINLINL